MSSVDTLWKGLSNVFQRDGKGDFKTHQGEDAIDDAHRQILGTRCSKPGALGEMPWNPKFGSRLDDFRHDQYSGSLLAELGRHEVVEKLSRFENRSRITRANVTVEQTTQTGSGRSGRTINVEVGHVPIPVVNEQREIRRQYKA